MITVSNVVSHCFCPKFTYFGQVMGLQEFQEKRGTVMSGRKLHMKYEKTNTAYIPQALKGARRITETKLYSKRHGFVGIVDQAFVTDRDITLVERKYTDSTVLWPTLMAQIGLLSVLLEENYGLPVRECIVVFTKTQRTVKHVDVTGAVKADALASLEAMRGVVRSGVAPDAEYSQRCVHCCYRKVCPVGSLYTDQ